MGQLLPHGVGPGARLRHGLALVAASAAQRGRPYAHIVLTRPDLLWLREVPTSHLLQPKAVVFAFPCEERAWREWGCVADVLISVPSALLGRWTACIGSCACFEDAFVAHAATQRAAAWLARRPYSGYSWFCAADEGSRQNQVVEGGISSWPADQARDVSVRMRMSGHGCLHCLLEGKRKVTDGSEWAPPMNYSSHLLLHQNLEVTKELRGRDPKGFFTLDASQVGRR